MPLAPPVMRIVLSSKSVISRAASVDPRDVAQGLDRQLHRGRVLSLAHAARRVDAQQPLHGYGLRLGVLGQTLLAVTTADVPGFATLTTTCAPQTRQTR